MASATFTVSLGVRGLVSASAHKRSTFAISAGAFYTPNPYGSGAFTREAPIPKSMLPPAGTPFVFVERDRNGGIRVRNNPVWDRFLRMWWQDRMGGDAGPTMAEVQTNVVETKTAAVNAAATAQAVTVQVNANAEALAATVEVAQTNGLSGSESIPPVVRRTTYTHEIEL